MEFCDLRDVCFLSRDAFESVKGHRFIVVVKDHRSEDLVPRIFRIRFSEKLADKSLSYCNCTERTSSKSSSENAGSVVSAIFVTAESLFPVDKIVLKCTVYEEVLNDESLCQKILNSVQSLVKSEASIACNEGQTLTLRIDDSSHDLIVSYLEPASSGIWTCDTELQVELVTDERGKDDEAKVLSEFKKFANLIPFSGSVIWSFQPQKPKFIDFMQQSMQQLTDQRNQYHLKEIPSRLTHLLIRERAPTTEGLTSCCTAVMNPSSNSPLLKYVHLKTLYGVATILPVVLSFSVERNCLYCPPSILKSLNNFQKEIEENFCDKIRLEAATSDPQIVHVSKLEISSLNCQLLNELGPLDPDALLAEFFRLPKYFPVFSDQVKMLPTFITDCD